MWVGVGGFLRWWLPSAMWAGPLIFYGHHRGCLNNNIFWNVGLCAACWAHSMCHHELWSTSVSHPFSSPISSLGLTGGKHFQKITIHIFRLILQNFAFPGCFSYIFFYRYIFPLLSSGWVVTAACDSQCRELVKYQIICKLMQSCHLQWQVKFIGALTFCCSNLIPFFLLLFVVCILWVIYVREDNYFIYLCIGYDNTAHVDCMDLTVCCPRKAVKSNHSLIHARHSHW